MDLKKILYVIFEKYSELLKEKPIKRMPFKRKLKRKIFSIDKFNFNKVLELERLKREHIRKSCYSLDKFRALQILIYMLLRWSDVQKYYNIIINKNYFVKYVLRLAELATSGCVKYSDFYFKVFHEYLYKKFASKTRCSLLWCSFEYRGKALYLPYFHRVIFETFVHEYGLKNIYFWSKQLYYRILDYIKGKTAIDGGAYYGETSLLFALLGFSKVLAIEPETTNFTNLKKVIAKNKLVRKILPLKVGLSNRIGKMGIVPLEGMTKLVANNERGVNVYTIDHLVNKLNLGKIGLIKLDVEGLELEILEGARRTIKRDKPILLVASYHYPAELIKILEFLYNINYRVFIANTSFPMPITETILVGIPGGLV